MLATTTVCTENEITPACEKPNDSSRRAAVLSARRRFVLAAFASTWEKVGFLSALTWGDVRQGTFRWEMRGAVDGRTDLWVPLPDQFSFEVDLFRSSCGLPAQVSEAELGRSLFSAGHFGGANGPIDTGTIERDIRTVVEQAIKIAAMTGRSDLAQALGQRGVASERIRFTIAHQHLAGGEAHTRAISTLMRASFFITRLLN